MVGCGAAEYICSSAHRSWHPFVLQAPQSAEGLPKCVPAAVPRLVSLDDFASLVLVADIAHCFDVGVESASIWSARISQIIRSAG